MNPQTPSQDPPGVPSAEVRAWLSALTDGEADAQATAGACTAWREEPAARAVWHQYQLIGDVLRSSELASPAARDAVFLSAVRARLAAEPVVLAPASLLRPTGAEAGGAAARTAQRRFGRRVHPGPRRILAGSWIGSCARSAASRNGGRRNFPSSSNTRGKTLLEI